MLVTPVPLVAGTGMEDRKTNSFRVLFDDSQGDCAICIDVRRDEQRLTNIAQVPLLVWLLRLH